MKDIAHPSTLIEADWQSIIRNNAPEAEVLGKLHPEQLELIYQQKWFKALMPIEYGGLNLSLPELVRLQEGLSFADGSFGWVFTLCCGAGWFAGFIDKGVGPSIFNDEKACLAGSGAQTGEAIITDNGYIINGQWNYASGAHHATHFTANCVIKKDGQELLNADGSPLIHSFIIDKKDVELLPTWKYIGMVATGSHSFKIENIEVDKTRCFQIDPDHATIANKLYQYPFLQLAEATLAANLSGMAIHFIDLAENIIEQRAALDKFTYAQKAMLTEKLYHIKTEMQDARTTFYHAVDISWRDNNTEALKWVSINSRQLAKAARNYVDALYTYCGLQAASPDTEINRVWRDLHTASQHSLLVFES
ncbi:MAG: acyl-CoA dehydrogenase [Sphingobacteriaceae bacterium]|nr:MAG: acyl-CoA dehydrogenase [Sphingobacteriaceae bacterium]